MYTPPNDMMILMLRFYVTTSFFLFEICCLCVNDVCIYDFKLKLVINTIQDSSKKKKEKKIHSI